MPPPIMISDEDGVFVDKLSGKSFRRYSYFEHIVIQDVDTGYINAGSFVKSIMKARGINQKLKDFKKTKDYKHIIEAYSERRNISDARWGEIPPPYK